VRVAKILQAEEMFFLDSGVTYDTSVVINSITVNAAGVAVVNATSHGLIDNDIVILYCAGDFTGRFKADQYNANLFTIVDTITSGPLNALSFDGYVSGGVLRKGNSSFTGLSHLEGQEVVALADGLVKEDITVSSGAVTLTEPYGLVHIGLAYNCDIQTLDIERPDNEGSLQGRQVKVGNVTFRVVDTRGGFIGPDEDHLYEAFTPGNFNLEDDDISLFTGDVRVPLGGEYSSGGRIFYRQSNPLPVTISSIVPEIQTGGQSG
jgi:hypothetical protein